MWCFPGNALDAIVCVCESTATQSYCCKASPPALFFWRCASSQKPIRYHLSFFLLLPLPWTPPPLSQHAITKDHVAIKIIEKAKLDKVELGHLHCEVRVMKLLRNPNVVRLYQVVGTFIPQKLILALYLHLK